MEIDRRYLLLALLVLILSIVEQLLLPDIVNVSRTIYNSNVFIYICGITLFLGFVTAIPKKGDKNFIARLKFTTLVSFIASCSIADITYGALMFKKNKNLYYIGPRKSYKEAKAAPVDSCLLVHDGAFEDENITIIRNGNRQVQTYKKSHKREIFTVRWLNECEYELIRDGDPKHTILVKIIAVKDGGFTSLSSSLGSETGREYSYTPMK